MSPSTQNFTKLTSELQGIIYAIIYAFFRAGTICNNVYFELYLGMTAAQNFLIGEIVCLVWYTSHLFVPKIRKEIIYT